MRNVISSLRPLRASLPVLTLLFGPASVAFSAPGAETPSIRIGGFAQITAIKGESSDALVFGYDRVRLQARGRINAVTDYHLQLDFSRTSVDVDKDGDSDGIIKDVVITYRPGAALRASVGKFKTPIGMEFNTAGKNLDFVKRGLGQALVFERNAGAMLSAKGLGAAKLGFACGVFNAGPNKANDVGDPTLGSDYTLAARVDLRPDPRFYAQAYAGAALTSVAGQGDVQILGAAARVKPVDGLALKAEFMSRDDPNNDAADGSDYYLQAGYLVHPHFEPVIKYEELDVTDDSRDQANTTLGLNCYLSPKPHRESKIMLNYIFSDLDGGDALQVLFQVAY